MKRLLALILALCTLLCTAAYAENTEELPWELQKAQELGLWDKSWVRSDITIENFMTMLDRVVELAAPDRLDEFKALYPESHDNYIGMKRTDGMAALYLTAVFLGGEFFEYGEFDHNLNDSIGEIWHEYGPSMQAFPGIYDEDESNKDDKLPAGDYSGNAYFWCISKKCPLDGAYLLDFDKGANSFRTADVFTLKEAATAVVRFYSCYDPGIVPEGRLVEIEN